MTGRLAGRAALVIGASPNIGGAIGLAMAEEGAAVAFFDRRPEIAAEAARFLRARARKAIATDGDAGTEADVARAVGAAVAAFGRIDILVSLAGRQTRFGVLDFDLADWNRQMESYVGAAALATKHAARAMVDRRIRGSIIHIASDAAHQGEAGNSGYSAAKAAVVNFARAAAAELGEHGVRVNTISPTYMENNLWKYGYGEARTPLQATAQDFLDGAPLRRFCRASDVAAAAVFLASDEASFITGIDLPLDGGARAKYWPWRPGDARPTDINDYTRTARRQRFGEPT